MSVGLGLLGWWHAILPQRPIPGLSLPKWQVPLGFRRRGADWPPVWPGMQVLVFGSHRPDVVRKAARRTQPDGRVTVISSGKPIEWEAR